MFLLQSTFLAALGAMAIPLIVHWVFRSRARRIDLGTLRFLRAVLERNAQRQRILRWFLLALRMGAVALLAMVFARPYFLAAAPGGDGRLLIALIDSSATMDLKHDRHRLVDDALSAARELVSEQGAKTRVEIAFFDHVVRPLFDRTADASATSATATEKSPSRGNSREEVLSRLNQAARPKPSFRATDYGAAFAWARDVAVRFGGSSTELHVWTDLQRSGMAWTEAEPLPPEVRVVVHDLGRNNLNNVAVVDVRPSLTSIRPGESIRIQATLVNHSEFPIESQDVQLRMESESGGVTQRDRARLEPHQTAVVSWETPPLAAGVWSGVVRASVEDDLPFDDARHFAVLVKHAHRVLLLDGQPKSSPLLSETYFLDAALRLAPPGERWKESPFDAVVAPLTRDDRLPRLEGFDVVVLANVAHMGEDDAKRLAAFVKAGGGLVVFGGELVVEDSLSSLSDAGLLPGRVGPVRLADDLPYRFDSWNDKHPLLKLFDDPQRGDLRRIAFRGYSTLERPRETSETARSAAGRAGAGGESSIRTLARFRHGDPAIVEQDFGDGTVLWFASSCDRSWSEWPAMTLFVPLIHRLIGQPLGLNDGGLVRSLPLDGSNPLSVADNPGVRRRGRFIEVVNASPRESEPERAPLDEFASRFQFTQQDDSPSPSSEQRRNDVPSPGGLPEVRSDEQWPLVLLALFGVLFLESFVANRTVG